MSGGSMSYLHFRVREAEFLENTLLRKAFREHLNLVADAMHDIEWVDSGDCSPGTEEEAIRKCLSNISITKQVVKELKDTMRTARKLLKEII